MTTQGLIQLLRPIFKEVITSEGKLSAIEAVEVIEEFKSQIQNETIEKFTSMYNFLYQKKSLQKRANLFPENMKILNKHW